jgi:hypothetical protein
MKSEKRRNAALMMWVLKNADGKTVRIGSQAQE